MKDEYSEDELRLKYYDEGMEKGMEKGIEEGIRRQSVESAKKMVAKGVDVSLISELTGLTVEEISQL